MDGWESHNWDFTYPWQNGGDEGGNPRMKVGILDEGGNPGWKVQMFKKATPQRKYG